MLLKKKHNVVHALHFRRCNWPVGACCALIKKRNLFKLQTLIFFSKPVLHIDSLTLREHPHPLLEFFHALPALYRQVHRPYHYTHKHKARSAPNHLHWYFRSRCDVQRVAVQLHRWFFFRRTTVNRYRHLTFSKRCADSLRPFHCKCPIEGVSSHPRSFFLIQ